MITPPFVQDRAANQAQFLRKDFAFIACQHSAAVPLKRHLIGGKSAFRLAFSRPGLLTLKRVPMEKCEIAEAEIALPSHPLVRGSGWVLGQSRGQLAQEMVRQVQTIAGDLAWDAIHVFDRDPVTPGDDGFEPGESPLCEEIGGLIQQAIGTGIPLNQPAAAGSRILDIVLAEPNHWLVGYHHATAEDISTGWPGGVYRLELPDEVVSRAYLKIAEAIAWSGLPIESGESIVEIGSSPGGAAQRLLDMGLVVTGIDPAEMDPMVLEHPRFTHWRAKSSAVKRKLYRNFRWLAADANVAPNYTLDAVEDIVTYPTSRFEGLLLTLKLSKDELVDQIDAYIERIRSWQFAEVRARQLSHNRREVCVVARRT